MYRQQALSDRKGRATTRPFIFCVAQPIQEDAILSIPRYKVGDMIVLKSGLTRTLKDERSCKVIGVLPRDHVHVQYRVKFTGENFERRILEDDIDPSETVTAVTIEHAARAASETGAQPWLKPLGVRARK
jgi:hypothetical protein